MTKEQLIEALKIQEEIKKLNDFIYPFVCKKSDTKKTDGTCGEPTAPKMYLQYTYLPDGSSYWDKNAILSIDNTPHCAKNILKNHFENTISDVVKFVQFRIMELELELKEI